MVKNHGNSDCFIDFNLTAVGNSLLFICKQQSRNATTDDLLVTTISTMMPVTFSALSVTELLVALEIPTRQLARYIAN